MIETVGAGIIAGVVVVGQWYMVRANDAFTLVQHEGQTYKLVSYGFPFRVVDCNAALGLATPIVQAQWRLIGNWATFCLGGLTLLNATKMLRTLRCALAWLGPLRK